MITITDKVHTYSKTNFRLGYCDGTYIGIAKCSTC